MLQKRSFLGMLENRHMYNVEHMCQQTYLTRRGELFILINFMNQHSVSKLIKSLLKSIRTMITVQSLSAPHGIIYDIGRLYIYFGTE